MSTTESIPIHRQSNEDYWQTKATERLEEIHRLDAEQKKYLDVPEAAPNTLMYQMYLKGVQAGKDGASEQIENMFQNFKRMSGFVEEYGRLFLATIIANGGTIEITDEAFEATRSYRIQVDSHDGANPTVYRADSLV